MRFSWRHFSAMGLVSSWWHKTPTYFQQSVHGFSFAYLFPNIKMVWWCVRAERWREKTGYATHQHQEEVKDKLKGMHTYGSEMYLTGRLLYHTRRKHIQPTHKHLRAVLTPASLLGTALGPEGPRCRRRMGDGGGKCGGGGGGRGRDRWEGGMRESERDSDDTQYWMSPRC